VIAIVDTPHGAVVAVRVIPRARRSAIDGEREGALLVRLSAAPADGAANEALLDLLAHGLGLPRRALTIVSGERSRAKRIAIAGMAGDTLRARLSAILHR
jgi:uncharacterized protein (TIGR00251 family)